MVGIREQFMLGILLALGGGHFGGAGGGAGEGPTQSAGQLFQFDFEGLKNTATKN